MIFLTLLIKSIFKLVIALIIIIFISLTNTNLVLSPYQLDNIAITTAIKEYYNLHNNKQYLLVVDFTKPMNQKRMYIIDMYNQQVIDSIVVSQGHSPPFSNKIGSKQSSIGVYITGSIRQGVHGNARIIYGISKGYNDNAYIRHLEIHSALYAGTGHTWGCFGVSPHNIREILKDSTQGTLLVAYYPSDLWT